MQDIFVVYKDPSYKVSRPWTCDVIRPDNDRLNKWLYGFRTKALILTHINSFTSNARIVRGADIG